MLLRCGLAASLVVAGLSLHAQAVGGVNGVAGTPGQPAVETPSGSVTGIVIAQDTQRPVRFAQVQFQRVSTESGGDASPRFGGFGGGPMNVRTDVDGTFTASGVPVGDYYVLATAAGYVSQGALLRAQVAAGADVTALLAALPVVRVAADSSSNVTVSIQRGGVIAGHIEWEDGSVASGVNVNAVSTAAVTQPPQALRGFVLGGGTPSAQTDDRGNFRIAGLATGEYVVTATVQSFSQIGGAGRQQGYSSPIRVYAPGVFRRGDAKVTAVRAGDERTEVRIVIDLRGLHTVAGHASSANPGETVARGNVQLVDSTDNSLNLYAQLDTEGSFKIRYVPPGTYTLRISGANSQPQGNFRGGRGGDRDNGSTQPKGVAFQDFSTTVTVSDTDVTGVAVSLVPVQSQAR